MDVIVRSRDLLYKIRLNTYSWWGAGAAKPPPRISFLLLRAASPRSSRKHK
jgi:hypothetical protein